MNVRLVKCIYICTYLPFQNPFLFYDYVHFENSSIDFNCIFCTLFGCQISALVTFHNSLQSQWKIILILESVESFLDLNLEVYLLTEVSQLRLCECRWRGTTHLQLSQPFFVLILVRIVCVWFVKGRKAPTILKEFWFEIDKKASAYIRRLSWKFARRLLRIASESR